jgi:ABC-2 type transport system ATP-binding protein
MATAAIEAHGLVKRYGEVTAVAGVDLTIAPHSIYALLGPNGAGKTTTISMLTTLVPPTAGSARVAGYDITNQARQVRRQIGVTFQDIVLDLDLTGRQVLDIHGKLYRMRRQERKTRITRLVELVQLEEAIDRRVKTYSGGMKRRLELARGLLTDPQILFLDEPTQGLDPQNRIGIWNYIRELNRERGMTLLLTTHYMEEAEALAHAVGIIDHGKMVAEGKPASLVSALGADVIRVHGQGDQQHFLDTLGALPFVEQVQIDEQDNLVQVFVDNGNRRLVEVVQAASGNGFCVEDIAVAQPSLGDVFLRHTGRTFRD